MSDVGVAPAPAPTQAEVPVNPSPVNAPAPVTNQPPEKAPDDMKSADHRRDSIRQAFERAKARDPNDRGEPRKARMGDNQPPEEMKPEREKPERIDLKKTPSDQPRERGRFAPRERAESQAATASDPGQARQPGQPGQQPAYKPLPEGAPHREPLARMTDRAKQDWHGTPDTVRADVHRMHTEFSQAFQRYQADNNTMNSIRQFESMAREHGTTLQKALGNYVSMEQKLRSDPIGGLDLIVYNLNLRGPNNERLTFADVCWHYLNQTPEQHKLTQSQNAQMAQSHQLGQLHQMVNTLAQATQEMQYEKKFEGTRSALDRYADDGRHPRFDELGRAIEQEIKLGFDVETAYQRANLLYPATAAQTRNSTTTAAQTRSADPDRSIHGAPDSGSMNGAQRRSGKPVGRREAIANAIKRVGGSL